MSQALFMDVHVPRPITEGLRQRGIDVSTAQEDGMRRASDPALLDRALVLKRLFFTCDTDLIVEARRRQRLHETFASVIYGHQQDLVIGECISDLELICHCYSDDEIVNTVTFLPL